MLNVPTALGIVVTMLGAVGSVAAAVAVYRQQGIKSSLEVLSRANAELRLANEDLHQALSEERQERAKLEGKLEVFTTHFAEQILAAVIRTVESTRTTFSSQIVTEPARSQQ